MSVKVLFPATREKDDFISKAGKTCRRESKYSSSYIMNIFCFFLAVSCKKFTNTNEFCDVKWSVPCVVCVCFNAYFANIKGEARWYLLRIVYLFIMYSESGFAVF